MRQDVLEGLGWRFHRIWSTDWFHRKEAEIRRLADILQQAKEAAMNGIVVRGANADRPLRIAAPTEEPAGPIEIGHLELTAPAYTKAGIQVSSNLEPHEVPQGQMGDLILTIVEIEGPIHVDELARRISSAFGKARTGTRIVDATLRALAALQKRADQPLERAGPFVMTPDQSKSMPIRDRKAETGNLLKAEYLPPMEIAAAADRILVESGTITPEEMTKAVARLLGFQRVGPELSATILAVLMEK